MQDLRPAPPPASESRPARRRLTPARAMYAANIVAAGVPGLVIAVNPGLAALMFPLAQEHAPLVVRT